MRNIVDFTEIEAYVARVWQGQRCILKPYFFNATFENIQADSSATQTIKINSNADFLLTELRAVTASSLSIQITDGATLEQFYSSPVPVSSVATLDGYVKQSMSVPRRIAGNSLLTIELADISNVQSISPQISLVGVLVFTL